MIKESNYKEKNSYKLRKDERLGKTIGQVHKWGICNTLHRKGKYT